MSSGKSATASSLESTSHGSSGVQSTSAASTFSPPSDRDPLAIVCSADLRPDDIGIEIDVDTHKAKQGRGSLGREASTCIRESVLVAVGGGETRVV